MKKIQLLFTFILINQIIIHGQELLVPNATAGYHTNSPETTGTQKQSSIPVNLSTGVPQIGLPIVNLAGKSTAVSYSLSYDATGRKVDEQAQYTGWGWNLAGGGQITRVVNGRQDEYDSCIDHAYQNLDGYSELIAWDWKNTISGNSSDKSYVTSLPSYNPIEKQEEVFSAEIIEFQPDEYHFTFNGRSGMFVIDEDGLPALIPFQNLKIEFQACLHWFKITDESGYIYEFGLPALTEFGLSPHAPNSKAATTWHLLTIKNPYGETEFTFNYGSEQINQVSNSVNIKSYYDGSFDCPQDGSSHLVYYTKYHFRRITSVVSQNGSKIEFYCINNRLDKSGEKSLDEIWLYNDEGAVISKYLFEYDYFLNQNNGKERLKLINVKVKNSSNQIQEISSFGYEQSIPIFDNEMIAGKDHWGYYNGLNFNSINDVHFNGGRRRVNPNYNQIGILKEIISSTGSRTAFDFETNTYSESPNGLVTNQTILGPQLIQCSTNVDPYLIEYVEPSQEPWTYVGPTSGFFPDEDDYPEPNCELGYTFHNPNFSYNLGPEIGSDGRFEIDDDNDIDHPNHPNNTDLYDLEISYLAIPKSKYSKKIFSIDVTQSIHITGEISASMCNGILSSVKIINHNYPNNVVWSQNGIIDDITDLDHTMTIDPGTYELLCTTAFPYFENVETDYIPNNPPISSYTTQAEFTFTPLLIPAPAAGVSYGGGLRIVNIITDNGTSNSADDAVTKFEYDLHDQPGISSGYLFSDPKYDLNLNYYFDQYKRTGGGCGGGLQLCHECDFKQHISSGINSLISANGSFHVYRNVRSRVCAKLEDTCNNGWTEEVFSYETSTNANPVIQESNPYQNWKTGLSLESRIFNQNGELVSTVTKSYSDLFTTPRQVIGIRAGVTNVESIAATDPACELNNHDCSFLMDYLISYYNYSSNAVVLTETISKNFDQLDQLKWIESTSTMYYGSVVIGLPKMIASETADPQKPITEKRIKYVGDYTVVSANNEMSLALNYLLNIGHFGLNTPVETITLQGNSSNDLKVIAGELNTFKMIGNRVVADATYKLELAQPVDENSFSMSDIVGNNFTMSSDYRKISKILHYDGMYRPISTQNENDISYAVIRDYTDGRVVAEVTNAQSDECAYTSFETTNGGGWTYSNSWTTSPSFSHLGFNLKKAKTGTRIFGFQGTSITKQAKPGMYIVSLWSTSPAFSLSVNGQNQTRIVEEDGEDVMGWAYYEYLVDCTQNYDISITGSIGEFVDELRMYPVDAEMKTVAYNLDGTVRSECNVNNRCTTFMYDSWKRLEWSLDDKWEILTYNEYHIKDKNNSNDYSWNKQKVVLEEGINKTNVISATAYSSSVSTSISYSDGLGRPLQSIAVRQSPNHYDMVSFHEYDVLGREAIHYAPFTRPANNGNFIEDIIIRQKDFYDSASKITHTSTPYAESIFEQSPLNRVVESGSMGADWQVGNGHTIQSFTLLNDGRDEILQWENYPGEGACAMNLMNSSAMYYPDNTLIKKYIVNEHGDEMFEFTNSLGQVICKRIKVFASQDGTNVYTWTNDDGTHSYPNYEGPISGPAPEWEFYDTYFIYDNFGRLIYEIPAIAVNKFDGFYCFGNHSGSLNYSILDGYITMYGYDKRGRQILKKKPGEELSQFVYNTLNQVVLIRSPELLPGQWNFIKYDALGRPVQTGLFQTTLTREDLQLVCDGATTNLWELKSGSTSAPYQGNSFPLLTSNDVILTETYYDDYNFDLHNFLYDFSNTNHDVAQLDQGKRTRGATTGMKVRILDSTDPYPYLLTINYFDKNGKSNLSFKEHIFGGFDRFLTEYDYTGKVTQTLRTHKKTLSPADDPIYILNQYTYDHAGRPLLTKQKINGGDLVILSKLNYNELGQTVKKQLHLTDETNVGMQTIDYRYNERGWLTKINNADLVNDGDNMESWDVFGEELIYQEQDRYYSTNFNAIPQYNGNISAVKWKTKDQDQIGSQLGGHSYVYRYDQLGQMLGAFYVSSSESHIDNYCQNKNLWDERLSYDSNGNILSLKRFRGRDADYHDLTDPMVADDLSYMYQVNTNKVMNIVDVGDVSWHAAYSHFIDVSNDPDYEYDDEARLKGDWNKNIEYHYNHLDLVEWAGNSEYIVDFVWDATGSKLRTISPNNTTTYIGGIEYKDGQLTHLATAEGIVRMIGSNHWTYDYYLKDHLGNIRAVLATEESEIISEKVTMELMVRMIEDATFENVTTTAYDKPYLYPYDPNDPSNDKVSKLNAQIGKVMGPSKVMAVKRSELLDVSTQYWYNEEPGESPIDNLSEILTGVMLNLTGAGLGVIPSGPERGLALINNVSGTQYQALENFITNSFDGIDLETTGAHLVYMFFDSDMRLDSTMSGRISVGDANMLGQISQQSLRMPEDGFFYVYVTNLSVRNVYFDNLTIKRWRPQLRVRYDYYPYGMLWENPDLQDEENRLHDQSYQGKEFMFGEFDGTIGLALYDFHARMYDPAMCRWLVPDPAGQFANPYLAMANNPVLRIDPDGRVVPLIVGAIAYGMIVGAGTAALTYSVTTAYTGNWDPNDFGRAVGMGALAGAVTGGFGTLAAGSSIAQNIGFGMMRNGVTNIASNMAFGNDISAGNIIGSIVSGSLTGLVPGFSGMLGDGLTNAIAEYSANSFIQGTSGMIGGIAQGIIDKGDILQSMEQGTMGGVINAAAQTTVTLTTLGSAFSPAKSFTDGAKRAGKTKVMGVQSKSINTKYFQPVWRRGGLNAVLSGRPVTVGKNITMPKDFRYDQDTYIHEYKHYLQQISQGFAAMQAIGIYEQLRFTFDHTYNPYDIPGTNEYDAEH